MGASLALALALGTVAVTTPLAGCANMLKTRPDEMGKPKVAMNRAIRNAQCPAARPSVYEKCNKTLDRDTGGSTCEQPR